MVLIDRITRYGDDFVEAGAQVKPDHILLAGGILPYTAFIELMAQAVGAYAVPASKPEKTHNRSGSASCPARANLKSSPNPSLSEHICRQRRICLSKMPGYGRVRLRTALDGCAGNFVRNTPFRRHFGARLTQRVQPRTPCRNNLMPSEQTRTYGEQP